MKKLMLLIIGSAILSAGLLSSALAGDDDSDSDSDSDRRAKKGTIAVESSPRKPVQITERVFGPELPLIVEFIEVPNGKRLIIQNVVLSARTAARDDAITSCELLVREFDGGGNLLDTQRTPLNVHEQRQANLDELNAGGPITMYAEASDKVLGRCTTSKGVNCVDEDGDPLGFCVGKFADVQSFTGSLAGYLVNVSKKRRGRR